MLAQLGDRGGHLFDTRRLSACDVGELIARVGKCVNITAQSICATTYTLDRVAELRRKFIETLCDRGKLVNALDWQPSAQFTTSKRTHAFDDTASASSNRAGHWNERGTNEDDCCRSDSDCRPRERSHRGKHFVLRDGSDHGPSLPKKVEWAIRGDQAFAGCLGLRKA